MEQSFHARSRRSGMETLNALFPITFVSFVVFERLARARPQPRVRGWLLKGFVFFALGGVVNGVVPALLTGALAGRALLPLGGLPVAAGALIGFVVADLAHYGRHRLMHRSPILWRLHQLHHSAERVDIAGAVYTHPLDLAMSAATTTVVATLLGLSPLAAGLAGYLGFAASMFTHLDRATPHWIAYVLHRPENHAVHHARGVHAYNYGVLTLWDRLFGTYREPDPTAAQAGFWDGASRQLGALLLGRDVSRSSASAPRAP
jgi:sterol desaturase/sphingolipid hydroxylase (fatty acid hydroxylase superfamily)